MKTEVVRALKGIAAAHLPLSQCAVLLYGSHAYAAAQPGSDIDVLFICPPVDGITAASIRKQIVELHGRLGLPLDTEVPYETKLIVSWEEARLAAFAADFLRDDQVEIPPIVKSRGFLASPQMRRRLVLNVLAGKSIEVVPGGERLRRLQSLARRSLIALMVRVHDFNSVTIDQLIDALMGDPPLEGEWYLGFKESPPVRAFLHRALRATLVRGRRDGWAVVHSGHWIVPAPMNLLRPT
jgi:predicted nucleotidyltransferase